jgi:AraC family transcriptional regulator, glycine betaine-responsive activator
MNWNTDRQTPWTTSLAKHPYRFGFLVVPNFTLIGLASAVDPLRLANQVCGRSVYEYVTISENGNAVRSSDGIQIIPDTSIAGAPDFDAVLVIGPNPIPKRGVDPILRWLRKLAHADIALGGVDTGSYFLARAGLLNGYRCTIHWEDMDELLGRFPQLIVSPNLFEVDRDRCSASGGIAAVDMMIHLIGLGSDSNRLAAAVSARLICEHRGPNERQRVPLRSLHRPGSQKLLEAVTLMECNIEEPFSMQELAALLHISPRHLERLFNDNLHCTPTHHYLQVRLSHAQQLLRRTSRSISSVSLACGFRSLAHFTSRYKTLFGVPPTLARRQYAEERAPGRA